MADIRPRDLMISFLIFTAIILGGIGFIDIAYSKNPDFVDADTYTDFKTYYDMRQGIYENISVMETEAQRSETPTILEAIGYLFTKGYQIVLLQFGFIGFFSTIAQGLTKTFGFFIPAWLPGIIIGILTTIIIYSVVSAFMQKDI